DPRGGAGPFALGSRCHRQGPRTRTARPRSGGPSARVAYRAGAQGARAARRGQDQPRDRDRALSLREDREELREPHPRQARTLTAGGGGRLRSEAPTEVLAHQPSGPNVGGDGPSGPLVASTLPYVREGLSHMGG